MKLSLLERLEKSQPRRTALNNCRACCTVPYRTVLHRNITESIIDTRVHMCACPYLPTKLVGTWTAVQ